MRLKTILIDVGNTLVYEKPPRAAYYAQLAAEHGVAIGAEDMYALLHRTHRETPQRIKGSYRYSDDWFGVFLTRLFGDHLGIPAEAVPDISAELFRHFSDAATFRLFPGAIELLGDFARWGLVVGIVSNWSPRLPGLLEDLGILQKVDFVLCSAIEELEKPEPELFARALERAGARPEEALHAGDHPVKDVAGARKLGIEAVLVDHAGTVEATDAPRVRSLGELGAYVKERMG